MYQEKAVSINGIETNYKVAGKGELILILHGWNGSSDSWIAIQKILAIAGYKVLVPDLPGFGKTKTPQEIWGIDDYVDWVDNFIKTQVKDKEPFFLIGHSFGGRLSIRYTVKNPEKLKKLILIASAGIKPNPEIKTIMISLAARIGNAFFTPRIMRRLRDYAKNLFYIFLRHKDYVKAEGTMRNIIVRVINEDLSADLPNIKTKTFLIWGDADKLVPVKYSWIFKEKIENSELKILPKIGHSPHIEIPEKLAEIIFSFLRK
mgnify:CR=1 FL=1